MPGLLPTADHLSLLLRLLDDDTPEVRKSVVEALEVFQGDVSECLGHTTRALSKDEIDLLSSLLRPARRDRLQREWIVPVDGAAALEDDWERVEALLRSLSDFLHDGVTLRQSLGDALDLLAEECEPIFRTRGGPGVCRELLGGRVLRFDTGGEILPEQLDLAAVASGRPTHALGAGLLVILVGRRLGAEIHGLNMPGSFLLQVMDVDTPAILDPESRGAVVEPEDFLHRIRRYPRAVQEMVRRPATPGELLIRTTEEIAVSLSLNERDEDADLMERLVESLVSASRPR